MRGVDGAAGNDPDKTSRTAMATGGNSGNNIGSVQSDEFRSHSHTESSGGTLSGAAGSSTYTLNNIPQGTGLSGGNETRSKNAYVNFCIKY